jgi:hypothetical protein
MKRLILGVVAGALAVMYWRDMRDMATRAAAEAVRGRMADELESLDASLGEGLDRMRATVSSMLQSWSRAVRGRDDARSSVPECSPSSEATGGEP